MLKRFSSIASILIIIICFTNCKKQESSIPPSAIEITSTLFRFDEVQTQETQITQEQINHIEQEKGDFLEVFNEAILRAPSDSFLPELNKFRVFFDSIEVNDKIRTQYRTIEPIKNEFYSLQKRLLTAEPNFQPLNLITINSGFNYKNVLLNDAVLVGLDMYLDGVDYDKISPNFPSYLSHTFQKENILPDIAQTILVDIYPDKAERNSLLKKIIYEGKLLEYKQQLLPNSKPHTLINMTEVDFNWCKNNERDIYRFFVSEDLLYDTNYNNFKTYVGAGPYSSGMPEGAPANTGSFIGWQIVKSYLQHNPSLIYEIMKVENSQEILNEAQYKP